MISIELKHSSYVIIITTYGGAKGNMVRKHIEHVAMYLESRYQPNFFNTTPTMSRMFTSYTFKELHIFYPRHKRLNFWCYNASVKSTMARETTSLTTVAVMASSWASRRLSK